MPKIYIVEEIDNCPMEYYDCIHRFIIHSAWTEKDVAEKVKDKVIESSHWRGDFIKARVKEIDLLGPLPKGS